MGGVADLYEMLNHHACLRMPEIRRVGNNRRHTLFFSVFGALNGDGGAGIADVRDHGHATLHLFQHEVEEHALFIVFEAHVLASRHRCGNRLGAIVQMKLNEFGVGFVVDAVVGLERRDRRMD